MTHRSSMTARDTTHVRRVRPEATRPAHPPPLRPDPSPASEGLSRAELRAIVMEVLG